MDGGEWNQARAVWGSARCSEEGEEDLETRFFVRFMSVATASESPESLESDVEADPEIESSIAGGL